MRVFWVGVVAATLSCAVFAATSAPAAAQGSGSATLRSGATQELVVPLNKSAVINVDAPVNELFLGNSEIADVIALDNRTVYVLGRQIGSTNLTVYGADGDIVTVLDVVVSYDVEALKRKLFDLVPEANVDVRSVNGRVFLHGTVDNARTAQRVSEIANTFAPDAVTNNIAVRGSQQVMLQVRFAEMRRSTARQLGLDFSYEAGDFAVSVFDTAAEAAATAPLGLATTGALGPAAGAGALIGGLGDGNYKLLFDALETRGLLTTLAEPNLVALSGDTAEFLAGGEFPFPVAQEDGAITVEFKEFGVGLSFTPTVIDGSMMNLIIKSEVSQLDQTQSVAVGGVQVPGLSTRRANTTIELRDGQAFAIAGLLQNDFTTNTDGLPWLSDVPVLGTLFSSRSFRRDETELVIIVTPRLVRPANAPSELSTPLDDYARPSDIELFLLGRLEGEAASEGVGLSGNYGHILE